MAYTFELLDCGNDRRIKEVLRMTRASFYGIIGWADRRQLLLATRNVTVEEKLAMFLITLGHGLSNRALQERFQHSGETVSW
jgi:site-specific recombinase XerC